LHGEKLGQRLGKGDNFNINARPEKAIGGFPVGQPVTRDILSKARGDSRQSNGSNSQASEEKSKNLRIRDLNYNSGNSGSGKRGTDSKREAKGALLVFDEETILNTHN
jgi:hypothetical protein